MNAEEVYALLNKKIKKGGITDDQIRQKAVLQKVGLIL